MTSTLPSPLPGRAPAPNASSPPPPSPTSTSSNSTEPPGGIQTLIDQLLAEQRDLTAVERFSARDQQRSVAAPSELYRDLIPLSAPAPGEQYAFEVDLDRCSGCKACVTACHAMNGLDEGESWRDVGQLVGFGSENPAGLTGRGRAGAPAAARVIPLQQTVTTACHHCVEPGCLLGCPVLAYDKDPTTGIVRHLDDQCIGCSYCILKCPYDVPKFSARRGIVRKCDLCHGRLAEGEAPACVQACPDQAIRITMVRTKDIAERWRPGSTKGNRTVSVADSSDTPWLPDSPSPAITLPTTRYRTGRDTAGVQSADHGRARLEPAHWPLVIMLVLTQAGAGVVLAGFFLELLGINILMKTQAVAGFLVVQAGLVAAAFHLGQPLRAWRSFLGWRTSWLSREIIAFGALSALSAASAIVAFLPASVAGTETLATSLWALAALTGGVAVYASAMVYIDTGRDAWNRPDTLQAFFGTTFLLGATVSAALVAWIDFYSHANLLPAARSFGFMAVVIRTSLFLSIWLGSRMARRNPADPLLPSVRAVDEFLPWVPRARVAVFVVSTLAGGTAIANPAGSAPAWATLSALTTLGGQFLERYLFFVTVAPRRMPGLPQ